MSSPLSRGTNRCLWRKTRQTLRLVGGVVVLLPPSGFVPGGRSNTDEEWDGHSFGGVPCDRAVRGPAGGTARIPMKWKWFSLLRLVGEWRSLLWSSANWSPTEIRPTPANYLLVDSNRRKIRSELGGGQKMPMEQVVGEMWREMYGEMWMWKEGMLRSGRKEAKWPMASSVGA